MDQEARPLRIEEEEMGGALTPAEEKAIKEALTGGVASCPRCGARLRTTPISPRPDTAYVRKRALLECDGCGLRAALDTG